RAGRGRSQEPRPDRRLRGERRELRAQPEPGRQAERVQAVPEAHMRYAPLALALALVLLAGPARASEGTCTVTSAISTNSSNLPFAVPVANGLVMPVEFDAPSGTFSMKRDAWSAQFGPGGAQFNIPFGDNLHGFLIMSPGTVAGTIDA